MSHSTFELEIQLLLQNQTPFDSIGLSLLKKLEEDESERTENNLNSLYIFLLRSGQAQLLIDFVIKHLREKKFTLPWGHLIEAVDELYEEVDPELLSSFQKGLKETKGYYQACRSFKWDALIGEMQNWRAEKHQQAQQNLPLVKKDLIERLQTLRTQRLFAAEKELLVRLNKMFPNDPEIKKEQEQAKERQAYDVLNRYAGLKNIDFSFQENSEKDQLEVFEKSLSEAAQAEPEMAVDFSIAALMLDDYEAAYQILQFAPESLSSVWLKTELQLKTRRYIELLDDLIRIEITFAADPETFFATALLRAQAFWGLGQKHTAIEILESLLATRPSYRSASILLETWRDF